jgi:hypothetical protein
MMAITVRRAAKGSDLVIPTKSKSLDYQKPEQGPDEVVCFHIPSYLESGDRRMASSRPAWAR